MDTKGDKNVAIIPVVSPVKTFEKKTNSERVLNFRLSTLVSDIIVFKICINIDAINNSNRDRLLVEVFYYLPKDSELSFIIFNTRL